MPTKDEIALAVAVKIAANPQVKAGFQKMINPEKQAKLKLTQRGLSSACMKDLLEVLAIDKQTDFLVVLHAMQILTEPYNCSMAELLVDRRDNQGRLYLSIVSRFVSHATSYKAHEDLGALTNYEGDDSQKSGYHPEYYFIDVFSVNQNDCMGDDELGDLKTAIAESKSTLLIFSPWKDPEVLKRKYSLPDPPHYPTRIFIDFTILPFFCVCAFRRLVFVRNNGLSSGKWYAGNRHESGTARRLFD
jgi:hypothetical protein